MISLEILFTEDGVVSDTTFSDDLYSTYLDDITNDIDQIRDSVNQFTEFNIVVVVFLGAILGAHIIRNLRK